MIFCIEYLMNCSEYIPSVFSYLSPIERKVQKTWLFISGEKH